MAFCLILLDSMWLGGLKSGCILISVRWAWRQLNHSLKVTFLSLLTSQYRGILRPHLLKVLKTKKEYKKDMKWLRKEFSIWKRKVVCYEFISVNKGRGIYGILVQSGPLFRYKVWRFLAIPIKCLFYDLRWVFWGFLILMEKNYEKNNLAILGKIVKKCLATLR